MVPITITKASKLHTNQTKHIFIYSDISHTPIKKNPILAILPNIENKIQHSFNVCRDSVILAWCQLYLNSKSFRIHKIKTLFNALSE